MSRTTIPMIALFAVAAMPLLAQDRGAPQSNDPHANTANNPVFTDEEMGFQISIPIVNRRPSRDWSFDNSATGPRVVINNSAKPAPYYIVVYVQLPDNSQMNAGFDPNAVAAQMLTEMRNDTENLQDVVQRSCARSRAIPGEGNCVELVVDAKLKADQRDIESHWFIIVSGRSGALVRIGVMTPRGEFAGDQEIQYILRSFRASRPRPSNQQRPGGR